MATGTGKHLYKAFWRSKTTEVRADTSFKAQETAAAFFKAKKTYEVTVMLLELDGQPYTHSTAGL